LVLSILLFSVAVRFAAVVWSVISLRRNFDWRTAGLAGLLVVLTGQHMADLIVLVMTPPGNPTPDDLGGVMISLAMSSFFLGTMYFLDRALIDRARAEHSLQASEERHRALVENALDMVWEIDETGHIVYTSPSFVDALGFGPAELRGRLFLDLIHPEDQDRASRDLRLLLASNHHRRLQPYRTWHRDGQHLWLETVGKSYTTADGDLRLIGVSRDITEQVEGEGELRARARQQESVANLGRRALASSDLDQVFKDAAHTIARTLGVEYCTLLELVPHGTSFVVRASAGWQEPSLGEVRFGADSGNQAGYTVATARRVIVGDFGHEKRFSPPLLPRYNDVKSGVSVLIPGSDRPFGVLCAHSRQRGRFEEEDAHFLQSVANLIAAAIDRDRAIRELQLGRERLFQSQKLEALGTLSGGIAHDFNNMLHAIIGNAQLALADSAPNSPMRSNLEDVLSAANRARELTKQILTFSLRSRPQREAIEVHAVVREVVTLMRASLPATIEIRQRIENEGDVVLADSIQLYQVLVNLCTNAGQAMRERGGVLEISVDIVLIPGRDDPKVPELDSGFYVRTSVRDTGHGIPSDIIGRIFEPFFSAAATGQGTGMGLAVAHGIIEAHHGAITVESHPGEGALFRVYLPRIEGTIAQREHDTEPIPAGSERILLIDDESALVSMGKQALGSLGYSVVGLTNSEHGLRTFLANPHSFDLVIMDQQMPGLRGDVLAKEILAVRSDIPIILCTGYTDQLTPEDARMIGIKEYLAKPVTIDVLGKTVRRLLDGLRN